MMRRDVLHFLSALGTGIIREKYRLLGGYYCWFMPESPVLRGAMLAVRVTAAIISISIPRLWK